MSSNVSFMVLEPRLYQAQANLQNFKPVIQYQVDFLHEIVIG